QALQVGVNVSLTCEATYRRRSSSQKVTLADGIRLARPWSTAQHPRLTPASTRSACGNVTRIRPHPGAAMTGTPQQQAGGGPAGSPGPLGEQARRAARVYGAAADHYDLAALGFWDRFGAETVSRLRLEPGQAVLDLCCGAGASALPAARAVGPAGRVLGIDIAAPLLDLARAKAARQGLANIEFRHGDA